MPPKEFVLYNGEVVLSFDEAAHVYTVEGKKVPSTTSITKVIDKPFLLPWAAKEAVEWLRNQWTPGISYHKRQIDYLLNLAKGAYRRKSEAATSTGTDVHNWIEAYCISVMNGTPPPEILHTEEAENGIQAFLQWFSDNEVVILGTEQKVYSRQFNYSGTYDLLAKVNGKLTVVDFKTSKAIYEEYYLQGAAYAKAYEEERGILPEQILILRVPKDKPQYEAKTRTDINELFEVYKACITINNWKK